MTGFSFVCLILALVCFLVATVADPYLPRIRMGWLGLAFWVASEIFRVGGLIR